MTEIMTHYHTSSYPSSGEPSRSQYLTPNIFTRSQDYDNERTRPANRKVAVNPTFFDDIGYSDGSFQEVDSSSLYSSVSTVDSHFSAVPDIKPHVDPSRLYLDVQRQKDEDAALSTSQKRRKGFKRKALAVGNQFLTMNAIIFGFGTQERLDFEAAKIWWDDMRIKYTVTENFVAANIPYVPGLKPTLKDRLKLPVAFGAGLTDETYMDWIIHKARRLFLILVHMGVPEQIFWIIDDAWDDADLPIARRTIPRLALSYRPDEEVDEKFWRLQFQFLLKGIDSGENIEYEEHEVVPIEVLEKLPTNGEYITEKVVRPYGKRSHDYITRITVPSKDDLKLHVETVRSRNISHANIVELFASYSQNDVGYLLYRPAPTITLDAFFRSPSYCIAAMSVTEKRVLAFNWIIGLASAIAFLHLKNIRHGDINPLSIYVMGDGAKLMLCDAGPVLGTLDVFNRQGRVEIRDEYGAPEDYADASGLVALFGDQPHLATDPALLCKSDVFSLACVMVDVLTFVSKLKMSVYKNHRRRSAGLARNSLSSSSSLGSSASGRSTRTLFAANIFNRSTVTVVDRPLSHGSGKPIPRRESEPKSIAAKIKKSDISFRGNLVAAKSWCDALVEAAEDKDIDGTGDAVVRELVALCCRGMFTEKPRERMGSGAVVSRLGLLAERLRKILAEADKNDKKE
ncbi:hypothetical protein H072_8706 [Dactylellina haptotyla CBS 200.50]|uniref:Protein kinase domain-containing protein n=1 Tax=Dactylellina haptotyla (strain CBS 200.50) TaxID=1284197 RepID=S8BE92_DACHA|nr:hypothetical protein H072_8706 [Dactylellina haptotyla CBS 200.50]